MSVLSSGGVACQVKSSEWYPISSSSLPSKASFRWHLYSWLVVHCVGRINTRSSQHIRVWKKTKKNFFKIYFHELCGVPLSNGPWHSVSSSPFLLRLHIHKQWLPFSSSSSVPRRRKDSLPILQWIGKKEKRAATRTIPKDTISRGIFIRKNMKYCWLGPDFSEDYSIENILRKDVSKVSIFRSSYDIFNASSSSKYVFVQSFPFLLSVCPNIRTGSGRTKDGRGMEKAVVDKEDWKLAHKLMIHTVEKENNLLFNVCYMLHVWFFNFKVGNFGRGRADFFLSLCEHKEEKRKDITQTALCLLWFPYRNMDMKTRRI